MTADHAREHIGHRVLYRIGGYAALGRITWAGRGQVLARIDGEPHPRPVDPGGLTLAENPR
jgi:hypothetical protein